MIVIGIDPGKQTGFAVYDGDRFLEISTRTFWEAFYRVELYRIQQEIKQIIIEVPDTKHVWQKAAASTKALQRQGVNVGSVIREAELLAEGLERLGLPVKRVAPRKKVNAEIFKKYTGYTSRTNQHERDAALLCFGRI